MAPLLDRKPDGICGPQTISLDVPATGKLITIGAMHFFRLRDGQPIEICTSRLVVRDPLETRSGSRSQRKCAVSRRQDEQESDGKVVATARHEFLSSATKAPSE